LSGPTTPFSSRAEYDALAAALVDSGAVLNAGAIYWDVRISEHQETMELRVLGACSRMDEAVMLAGLSRAGAHLSRAGPSR
jgi:glutamate---cysteine ligase / carboxylate-amine ligase